MQFRKHSKFIKFQMYLSDVTFLFATEK